MCFKWAVLSALHPAQINTERVSNYEEFQDELDFTNISFPVSIDDISKFERINNLPISIFTIKVKRVNKCTVSTIQKEEIKILSICC